MQPNNKTVRIAIGRSNLRFRYPTEYAIAREQANRVGDDVNSAASLGPARTPAWYGPLARDSAWITRHFAKRTMRHTRNCQRP
jgi:hypothetical protein